MRAEGPHPREHKKCPFFMAELSLCSSNLSPPFRWPPRPADPPGCAEGRGTGRSGCLSSHEGGGGRLPACGWERLSRQNSATSRGLRSPRSGVPWGAGCPGSSEPRPLVHRAGPVAHPVAAAVQHRAGCTAVPRRERLCVWLPWLLHGGASQPALRSGDCRGARRETGTPVTVWTVKMEKEVESAVRQTALEQDRDPGLSLWGH